MTGVKAVLEKLRASCLVACIQFWTLCLRCCAAIIAMMFCICSDNALASRECSHVPGQVPGGLALAGVSAGVSDHNASELFVLLDSAIEDLSIRIVYKEHSLSLARRADLCNSIRVAGLTFELAAVLAQAEVRLAAACAVMDDAEGNLRDAVFGALADRVGAENAAIAVRVASNLSRRVPDAWKALDLPPESPTWDVLESAWFKAQRGMPDGAFTQAEPAYPVRAAC